MGARFGKTGKIVIGARSGIFKARTDRRRSTEDCWKPEALELTGVPWRMTDDDDMADREGSRSRSCRYSRKESAGTMRMSKGREITQESMPRSFFITKMDTEQHGCSAKCPGCTSSFVASVWDEIRRKSEGHREVQEGRGKFVRHVVRALEQQDEEDRKRRKVEQDKNEAARTGDACRSEPMEETREKRKRLNGTTSDHGQRTTRHQHGSGWFGLRGDR